MSWLSDVTGQNHPILGTDFVGGSQNYLDGRFNTSLGILGAMFGGAALAGAGPFAAGGGAAGAGAAGVSSPAVAGASGTGAATGLSAGTASGSGMFSGMGTSLAMGGLSYLGQLQANEQNARLATEGNQLSQSMAREQMAFQERMSSTAHQREVEDLRKAGLNPLLSANAGASSPAGASGAVTVPKMEDALTKGISTAVEYRRLKKELEGLESQIAVNNAIRQSKITESESNVASAKYMRARAENESSMTEAIKSRAGLEKDQNTIDRVMLKYDNLMKRVDQATGAVGNVMGLRRRPRLNRETVDEINPGTGEITRSRTRTRSWE